MRTSFVSVVAVASLAAAVSFLCVERPSPTHPAAPTANAEGTKLLGRLPVAFVPNLGQWEHQATYVARVGAMTVFLQDKGWTFTLAERQGQTESVPPMRPRARADREPEPVQGRGVAVRMTFAGASEPKLSAEHQLPGRHNYFLGNDPTKWRSDVPLYGSVSYHQLYPGIDVRVREQDGHLEYDLMLEPQAQLEPVEVAVEGIERMRLDSEGTLVLETLLGPVRMPAPLTWEEGPSGERSLVTCRYVLRGENRFGFKVSGRRPGWALTVDPGLVYSTFLGGTVQDAAFAVALDAQGAATVAGRTDSADFPTTPGAFDTSIGTADAFVTRLSPTGSSLVYSTFLGGTGAEYAVALALDAQGAATVAGYTGSPDYPTALGAFDTSFNGGYDAFVTRLSPTGSSLVYSTFLGGTNSDYACALALDAQGAATVAGYAYSTDFPTTPGAFDPSFNGAGWDAFVTRLSPTGSSLVYSTYLGGTGYDEVQALALDAQGTATVAGFTASADFPTPPGAFDTSHNGRAPDAFVTRLSPTGSSLVYSTYLGGAGSDQAQALALDAQGAATVAGFTASADFPTTPGAFDTSYNGGYDAFVTRLSPTGSSLVFSTYLGGTGTQLAYALALDAQGAATVAGRTSSTDFPTTPGAFDTSYNGGPFAGDAFVARLSPTGASLVYSTFLGGAGDEMAYALALDAQGAATVAGYTWSSAFPTTPGAFDTTHNGGFTDAFVTRLDMLSTGVSVFGRSSPGCTGLLAMSVTSMPRVGNAGFALTCGNAPPATAGLLALTGGRFASPVVVLGVEIWVDPTLVFIQLPATSNTVGASEVSLPIPNGPWLRGTRLFAQFLWAGPTSPPPCPPQSLSTSHALEFTIQP